MEAKRTRCRMKEIKLEPERSTHAIGLRILIDGEEIHKLPQIKKLRPLYWGGLSLPCDVLPTSRITVEVTEIHTLQDRLGLATLSASDVARQNRFSIYCNNEMFTVKLEFLSKEDATHVYSDALAKAQQMEKPLGILDKAGKIGVAFKVLLGLGSAMADLDPTGGAKVAFALCTNAFEHLEQQDKQNQDLNNLVEDLAGMIPSVELVKDLANANLGETVIAMLNLIEDASIFILGYNSKGSWAQALYSIVESTSHDKIQSFITTFKRLRKEFDTRVSVQILENTEIDSIDSRLKPAELASYDPTRACTPGTRVNITTDITTWALKPNADQRLAWIQGLAGLGKSSIATTVCQNLEAHHVLAASFFCKRDNAELRDPRRVLTNIVYGLAQHWRPYKDAVVAKRRADSEVHTRHIQLMYDVLVRKPLEGIPKELRPPGILVVVIDALDECGDRDTRKQLLICLRGMSQLVSWLKIIVTSRPDPDIQEFFGRAGNGWFTEYNVLNYDALDDIRILIPELLGDVLQIDRWPEDAVEKLSLRSSGLFIWARTACKFITDGYNPCKRLEQVLSGARLTDSTTELDALYKTAIEIGTLDGNEDNISDVLECLGVIIVTATRTPLSTINLEKLLHGRISLYTLGRVIRSLSSVLYTDRKQDGAIRVSHPSFMDYITDRSRSKELCINLEQQNNILAECCLRSLMEGLKFNICELETSHMLNQDVPHLESRLQAAIDPCLAYSCVYWTSHLIEAQQDTVMELLRDFLFDRKPLYWIEAMSLLGKLSVALSGLLDLKQCLSDIIKDCRTYVYDVYRFVLAFYNAISTSTPHLYISALALAPEESEMAQRMQSFFPNRITVLRGADKQWTSCLVNIWLSSMVTSVAFSPDSRRIVSGSTDGLVRIWDAATGGLMLEPLEGHTDSLRCVTFSPDSRRIVSCSMDNTVRIWDAETGKPILEPLKGHSDFVCSVAISPDSRRIVSGSQDQTIRVWDADTGDLVLMPLEGHSGGVNSVAFSPDGRRIVSGSDDKTVRIWDAHAGQLILAPLEGHSDYVYSVAVSPDGRRIVSGSKDQTMRIWDAETGDLVLEPLGGHSGGINSIAFSPDGRRIVSDSNNYTVQIRNADTGKLMLAPLRGHLLPVQSVAFSSDGRHIVSGSGDNTMRIWDTEATEFTPEPMEDCLDPVQYAKPNPDSKRVDLGTNENTMRTWDPDPLNDLILEPSQGHFNSVYSVAFSPDSQRIVSGSNDCTVRVWDAKTGKPMLGPLEGHSGGVWSVAFSPDGQHIVSGSDDKTVRIWDAITGQPMLEPLGGHSDGILSVAFSPEGQYIVSGSKDYSVRTWDSKTGKPMLEPLEGHSGWVWAVTFSPDGHKIVSGSEDSTVRIWEAITGRLMLAPLEGHSDRIYSVAVSPNGRHIASGSEDQTIRIWDTETGKPVLEPLEADSGGVNSVAFSPDGRHIVSAHDDCTVQIWDIATGNLVFVPLQGHLLPVQSIALSSDGRRAVSGSWDDTIRIWDVEAHFSVPLLPLAVRYLPGTRVALTTTHLDSDIVSSSFQLARNVNSNGWVTMLDNSLLLWLPSEFRRLDDSLICIPTASLARELVVDFSKFVHGNSWSSIAHT